MRKLIFNRWSILDFSFIVVMILVVLIARNIEYKRIELYSNALSYYLTNQEGEKLDRAQYTITSEDLTDNAYNAPIYLVKNTGNDAYLRIFVTVSKQKDGNVYSLNTYNSTELEFTQNYSSQDWSNGNIITEEYGYDTTLEQEIGYYWRYYNKTVDARSIDITNTIDFPNGIEQGVSYIVTIAIDIIEQDKFNATTMWPDKPTNWQSQVV